MTKQNSLHRAVLEIYEVSTSNLALSGNLYLCETGHAIRGPQQNVRIKSLKVNENEGFLLNKGTRLKFAVLSFAYIEF